MMIHDIKTYNAQCDKCGKWFAQITYPSHRSLVVALIAMDWEVDDDYEYIHCPDCKTLSEIKAVFGPHIHLDEDEPSKPIKDDWKGLQGTNTD